MKHPQTEWVVLGMMRVVSVAMVVVIFGACSAPPKPPEPTGEWIPVNPSTVQASHAQQK